MFKQYKKMYSRILALIMRAKSENEIESLVD